MDGNDTGGGRTKVATAAVLVVLLAIGGLWYFVLRDEPAAERVSLDALTTTTTPAPVADDAPVDGPEGEWVVERGPEVHAGYRIMKSLPTGDAEVTGRTGSVTGELTVGDGRILAGSFEVDLASIDSGNGIRDGKMRTEGLETDTFPTATFELAGPVDLPAGLAIGGRFRAEVPGTLTLHGVAREVAVPVEGEWTGDRVNLVGTAPVVLADHGMTPPGIPGGSVADQGELEFQLAFVRG